MSLFITILLVAALILFVLAALNANSPRLNLGWLAAACVTLAYLLTHWPR